MRAPRSLAPIVLALVFACGASAREKTIKTTYVAVNAAATGFVAFDKKHQLDVVAQAKDRATAEAELAAWRAKQADVERAVSAAFRAIAAAAIANDDPSVAGMLQAATVLSGLLHDLGVTP